LAEGVPLWKELETIPKRMEALEGRLAVLEKALERTPGETCPQCGARSMRLNELGRRLGGRDAYRFDTWSCTTEGCRHSEDRKVSL